MSSTELSNSLTFPIKLKRIIDSPETDHLIRWAEDGNSFHITDENQFARDIIPNYFKHNNISSFIRQLNMYGFHKVNRIENGLSIIGTGNDDSQWVHPNFVRDKPELLPGVLRKVTNISFNNSIIPQKCTANNEIVPFDNVKSDIAQLAKMVQYLRKRDEETTEQLKALQSENHELYAELMFLRDQHDKQTKCIDMLIEFFSQYAKTPHTISPRLRPKRNILALECPKSQNLNSQRNSNEPPRKFQVTSIPESGNPTLNNNLFKGKKVITISNMNQPSHIDVKTPKIINQASNNGLYHLPTMGGTKAQKAPVIYTLSLPKTVSNATKTVKAITASQTTVPSIATAQINNSSFKNNNSFFQAKQNQPTKTVTVSARNTNNQDSVYNAQYFNRSPVQSVKSNVSSPQQPVPQLFSDRDESTTNIISGISSNVTDVEQCLNDIQQMFNGEELFDSIECYNQQPSTDINNAMADDDWKMLIENIRNDNTLQDLDPSRIYGHELIPFSGPTNDQEEFIQESADSYSIDDLLQTPIIQPGMSSLSLDNMDDMNYSSSTTKTATNLSDYGWKRH